MKPFLTLMLALSALLLLSAGELPVKDGEKLAFLGDSITSQGNSKPMGFINLVVDGLKTQGLKKSAAIPAGKDRDGSAGLLKRLDGVIAKKPHWLLVSCGLSDVSGQLARQPSGASLEEYQQNITAIVDKAQKAKIKVMLLTTTLLSEDPKDPKNIRLAEYNQFLRDFAKERNIPLADINARLWNELAKMPAASGSKILVNGTLVNAIGSTVIASEILSAFGIEQPELNKLRNKWNQTPGTMQVGRTATRVSVNEYMRLLREAARENTTIDAIVERLIRRHIDTLSAN